jgi:hypothetical protein
LQRRGAFPGGAGGPFTTVVGGVGEQQLLGGLGLFEADVAAVGVRDRRDPLVGGQGLEGFLPVGGAAFSAPAAGERTGVSTVVQGAQHPPVPQRHPAQLTLVGAGADPHGNDSPATVNSWTTTPAEPVRAKTVNRCRTASWTPTSGSLHELAV